jgi:hypothetical protein
MKISPLLISQAGSEDSFGKDHVLLARLLNLALAAAFALAEDPAISS